MARAFTLDFESDPDPPPAAGDMLFGVRAAWLILDARPVESRIWPFRWHLDVRTVERSHQPEPGGRAWHSTTYKRGEGPRDHFGDPPPAA